MLAPFTEGYSYQDNLLPEYQHKLGHEVAILTTTRQRDSNGKIIIGKPCDYVLDNGVRLIRINAGNKIRCLFSYYPRIKQVLEEIAPDLIFVHGLCQFAPHYAVKYKKKEKSVILKADNHQDKQICKTTGFPFSQMIWFWRQCWKRWISSFDKVYGTTDWRRDFAIEIYGIPHDKTDVLLMGVDSDNLPIDTQSVRQDVRKGLKICDEQFLLIHGGKMDNKKLTIEIMEAFASIEDPHIRLLLFGSVDESIRDKFDHILKSDPRIMYIGYIDSKKVHRYFFAADFGLFPGNHSVLWEESIGCQLPGIFRKYGSSSHTNFCGNSLTIRPNATSSEIANIIRQVVEDKQLYYSLKVAASAAAKQLSYYDVALKSIKSDFLA